MWYLFGLGCAVGCGDPGGCELLVIGAGWIARGSGARAGPPRKGTGGPGEGGVGQVSLQGNLAVAGRRGAESWEMGVFPRQRAGLQGVHTLSLQGVG